MRFGRASAGLLALCLAASGCGSKNSDATSGGEDQGQFPDTTPTDANMITPSDDAMTATDDATTAGGPSASASGM